MFSLRPRDILVCWIQLYDEKDEVENVFLSGFDEVSKYKAQLMKGVTPCLDKLKIGEIFSHHDSNVCCSGCVLAPVDTPQSILASYLRYNENIYGVMLVTTPLGKIGKDEVGLFREVVGDIGFALYTHEQSQKRFNAEKEREEFRLRLQSLHRFAYDVAQKTSVEEIGRSIVDVVKRVIGYDHISFIKIDDQTLNHILITGLDDVSEFNLGINDRSIVNKAYWSKKTQNVPDVRLNPDFLIGPAKGIYEPLSELCIPVLAEDEVIAIINIESSELNAFSDQDVQLVEIVANHVSSALQHLEHIDEILESEKRIRRLLDASRDGVTVNVDRKLVYVNNEFCEMMGYTRTELLGVDLLEFHTPEYKTIVKKYTDDRQHNRPAPSRYSVELVKKNGKIIIVEYQVSSIIWDDQEASLTYIRDITEQKEYQDRLEALHHYSNLLSSADSIDQIVDIAIDFLDQVIGANRISFQLREDDKLITLKTMPNTKYTSMNIDGIGVTTKTVRENRSILIGDTRKSPNYISGGLDALSELAVPAILNDRTVAVLNIESSIPYAFNIRDQKLMEIFSEHIASSINRLEHIETLIKLNQEHIELEQAKILNDMKNQFVSTATHELRTPVTAIQGYIDLIRETKPDEVSDEVKEMLEVVSRNCSRLSELTNDLLDMQRIEAGRLTINPTMANLNETVKEIVEELGHHFSSKNQTIKLELGELPKVSFDENRISQVLINLLGNASKFSDRGTVISVKTWATNGRIYVSVKDQGIGITSEDQTKLFKIFSNIERTVGYIGSGLGLSISKGIIELHNGDIWVESDGENKGSTFSFYLPLEAE